MVWQVVTVNALHTAGEHTQTWQQQQVIRTDPPGTLPRAEATSRAPSTPCSALRDACMSRKAEGHTTTHASRTEDVEYVVNDLKSYRGAQLVGLS